MQDEVEMQEGINVKNIIVENKNENTYFIHLLRIIACFAVVIIHININFFKDLRSQILDSEIGMLNLNVGIMSFAVPMFLTITGYIFLGYKKECTYKSLLKYLIKFLFIWVILGSVLNLGEYIFLSHTFDMSMAKKAVVQVLAGDTWDHMWYIRMIFFIYLILPVLKPFFEKNNNKDFIIFFILFLLEVLIIPLYNSFSPLKLYTHFAFENYILYVVLGAMLYHYKLVDNRYMNIIYIILMVIIICINSFYEKNVLQIGATFNIGTLLIVILIFTICRNLFNNENKIIEFISRYTFDIYIYHVIFLHIFTKVFKYNLLIKGHILLSEYILAIIIFIISLLFSIVIKPIEDKIVSFIVKKVSI